MAAECVSNVDFTATTLGPHKTGNNDATVPLTSPLMPTQTSRKDVIIAFPSTSEANNAELVHKVASLVNKVYADAESGIFRTGYERTDRNGSEIAKMIRDGCLALAYLDLEARKRPETSKSSLTKTIAEANVIGCVYIKRLSSTTGNFSMLALEEAYRGEGLGRDLVFFAEHHVRKLGCTVMQVELLVPTEFEHSLKTRVQSWYQRSGYRIVRLGSFIEEYPIFAPQLAGPADYKIFQKHLS